MRCDLQCDARGDVGLDKACDHLDRWPLCRKYQVDTDSAAHLRESYDTALQFTRICGHDVGQLVDNKHNVGHCLNLPAISRVGSGLARRSLGEGGGHDVGMVRGDITDLLHLEDVVAALHFFGEPLHREDGFFGVGDDRRQKMRYRVIYRELNALGVHHDKSQSLRSAAVEERHNEIVDRDGFSGAGGSGYQKMRHA